MARPQEGLQQRSECPRILHSAVHAHRPRERWGGETCHYCRNKSTLFTILRVTSYRMIHCTDGRSGEVMLCSTTKNHAWLGNVLLGTLLAILTLREPFSGGKPNPAALPAYANLCWALSTERIQHLTARYKVMGSLGHAMSGFSFQLLCLITVPHGWVPSSTSPPTHLSV